MSNLSKISNLSSSLNAKIAIISIISIIMLAIGYNLYKKDLLITKDIENFESSINKLSKNKTASSKTLSKKLIKPKKQKSSFDDLLKATEDMHPEKYTPTNIQKEVTDYIRSFKTEKFKNNSKNTAESFEKFALYKAKFFEIFK